MGIDATLFVVADYSGISGMEVAYVDHVLSLSRESELWAPIEAACRDAYGRHWLQVQLPHGSWSNYSGDVPDGYSDRESGFLQEDAYGNELVAVPASVFSVLKSRDAWNQAVFELLSGPLADRSVIVFWH